MVDEKLVLKLLLHKVFILSFYICIHEYRVIVWLLKVFLDQKYIIPP